MTRLFLLLALSVSTLAPNLTFAEGTLDSAREALTTGRPAEAESALAQLEAERGYAPGALVTLAVAQLRQGHSGAAVVSLERAHLLAPSNAEVTELLEEVRAAQGVSAPTRSRATELALRWPARRWMWGGGLSLSLLLLAVLVLPWVRRRPARRALTAALGIGALGAGLAASALIAGHAVSRDAFVVQPQTALYLSPFEGAEQIAPLTEGAPLKVQEIHGDFLRVSGAAASGWVSAAAVERLIPDGA